MVQTAEEENEVVIIRYAHMEVDKEFQKSPVFIVGCPRSGTSLLRDLLNSHPNIKIPGETTVLVYFYDAFGNKLSEVSHKEAHWLFTHTKQFDRLGIDLPYDAVKGETSLGGIFDIAFRRFSKKNGSIRWGEKTPEYALSMHKIKSMWPEAKFIHVIRDGRDVALSLKKVNFMAPKDTYVIAMFWKNIIETCRRDAKRLPKGDFMELWFEDLLAHPKTKVKEILKFLGEPYNDECLVPTRQFSSYDPKKRHDVVDKSINKGNTQKWKVDMSQDDLAIFEGVAGNMLSSLGYASAGTSRRRPGASERLIRRVKDFFQRVYMRIRRDSDNPLDVLTLYVYMHLKVRKLLWRAMHSRDY